MNRGMTVFIFLLVIFTPIGATEIIFAGVPYKNGRTAEEEVEACKNPSSEECGKVLKEICNYVESVIPVGMIQGTASCQASIAISDVQNTAEAQVKLTFTDPTVRGKSIDLDCVFPSLLRRALLFAPDPTVITLQNITFTKPILKPLEWSEETVTFRIFGDLLFNGQELRKWPNITVDLLAQSSLPYLILEGEFSYPLYPYRDKNTGQINYYLNEVVLANYTIQFLSTYLMDRILDPRCTSFSQLLEWGLVNCQSVYSVALGSNVRVYLASKITPRTTQPSTTETETAIEDSTQSTTTGPATTTMISTQPATSNQPTTTAVSTQSVENNQLTTTMISTQSATNSNPTNTVIDTQSATSSKPTTSAVSTHSVANSQPTTTESNTRTHTAGHLTSMTTMIDTQSATSSEPTTSAVSTHSAANSQPTTTESNTRTHTAGHLTSMTTNKANMLAPYGIVICIGLLIK